MQQFDSKELLSRYLRGECSEAEKALVERWYIQFNEYKVDIPAHRMEELGKEVFSTLSLGGAVARTKKLRLVRIGAAAAVFASLLGTFLYFEGGEKPKTELAKYSFPSAIDNANNTGKVIMTLANGKQINLSDADRVLLQQFGLERITTANGQITYKITGNADRGITSGFHSISTPKGADLRILLPDETKVWLNSATTLIFPSGFAVKRNLSLNGEAYFEVSKDRAHPFVVSANRQYIEVLGTHFNITAYRNEKYTRTTLLEGALKVSAISADGSQSRDIVLQPNQQAISTEGSFKVEETDAENTIGWIRGEFVFRKRKLSDIMLELSRWYDVEVVYQDKDIADEVFGGSISRFSRINDVLNMLELTGDVHFKISGKKILISR